MNMQGLEILANHLPIIEHLDDLNKDSTKIEISNTFDKFYGKDVNWKTKEKILSSAYGYKGDFRYLLFEANALTSNWVLDLLPILELLYANYGIFIWDYKTSINSGDKIPRFYIKTSSFYPRITDRGNHNFWEFTLEDPGDTRWRLKSSFTTKNLIFRDSENLLKSINKHIAPFLL
jgi:hypothetical protein